MRNIIRASELDNKYVDNYDTQKVILAYAAFSMRAKFQTATEYSLGRLFLRMDTILPIDNKYNWKLIIKYKQALIDENSEK